MTTADPVVMRSLDRLSATVQRQRTSLAASLTSLEQDFHAFVDQSGGTDELGARSPPLRSW